jgi:hypothetical protein
MRFGLCLAFVFSLQACTAEPPGPPADCELAKVQFPSCYEKYIETEGSTSLGFEAMWYACVPHSEPKVIEASWASDFEWNAFFEGRHPTPREAFPDDLPPTLAFRSGVNSPERADNAARLWSIKFIGREETCRLFPHIPPTFFAEEILEQRLIWEVAGYPTYTFEPIGP